MTDTARQNIVLDVEDIKKLLPHRAPMLMVERLKDMVPFESATGLKAVSFNEPYFMGHFPSYAVMPGVLIVEALAQTSGALVMHSLGKEAGDNIVYFMTIEKARFRKPVRPGDMLEMKVKCVRRRDPVWRFSGEAYVDGALVAEAQYSAMIQVPVKDTADDKDTSDGSR